MRALAKTLLAFTLALFALPAFAQQEPPARVGRVSIVEGALAFYGPGDNEWSAAKVNFPVAEDGWFATDPNSRTEFRVGTDSIFLANNTEAGFTRLRDKDLQLALQQGRVALHRRQPNQESSTEVDIARGGIWLLQRGEYDIDAGDADRSTRIAVFVGSARFVGGGVDITIKAGDALVLSGTDTLSATVEPATVDEFVRWCRAHDYHEDRLAAPHHVSPAMTGFEELDSYGIWAREADYGEVWFPKSVPADWAPYREGRWVWIEPWGWNWVDDEPWGFAPCHYGRWARIHDRWAWVPGEFAPEPVYAPALVAFISPPAIEVAVPADLGPPVGWFPLAPGEIYWPSYTREPTYIRNVNITNVNVTVIKKITQVAATERTASPPPLVVNQTFANRSAATVVPATVMITAASAAPAAIKLSPQAAAAPVEASVKGPASGQAAAPAASNTPSATPTGKSAGRPPMRPNFSQLAPAPQLARATAQTATHTTTPAAGPHTAGTPEQHQGQATAAIPPAGTQPAGERQQQPGQRTTEPTPGAHPAEQHPMQTTTAPPAPGRPPALPDFSHLAPSHGGQPGNATTPAAAGSQPSAQRSASETAPPPNPAAPSPHAASRSGARQELVQQRAQQEEILRQQAQQRAATEAAARQQAQQRAATEAAARQQAQQRAATEAAAQQQRAAAEASARQQAQQRAAAEAAARAQAQQAQQHAAAAHACGRPGEPPCPK